ncbi:phosphonate C-P lyase system protein PhnL [Paenibacillus alkalitolerans]|uniref:phosphonate C-P lyase system protein PhnL n=1 Tax=Paenibacillus alkalitolerans TaxID=2799335 RepID=UPI0018F5BFB9|nr:ATP-binding cassette domain-containing protein [Paenibacillus alkalitolerans]
MVLTVKNLAKTFELSLTERMIVNPFYNISFHVPKGCFMGIAGPSGIGKSSILKCVYRSYLPTSGSILYDSELYGRIDLAQTDDRRLIHLRRNEISYVTQFLKVIPRVSAQDVIAERLLPTGCGMDEARAKAREMLSRLRIPKELWDAFPATFSGGEQQRVNLARAFVSRPRLLILDEPTASLDDRSKEIVLTVLREMKEDGTTMIGVFHDWDVMGKIADHIFDMSEWKRETVASANF